MRYRRVTLEDRYTISAYLELKLTKSEIAQKLGFHKSTIAREISRNRHLKKKYHPSRADYKARLRYQKGRKPYSITPEVAQIIASKLALGWSPLDISGRMKDEGLECSVSHQTIYNFVKKHDELRSKLKFYGRAGIGRFLKRKRRMRVGMKSIHERPKTINQRRRFGDWERDTMAIADHKGVLVLAERKSRYLKIAILRNKTFENVALQTKALLNSTKKKVWSITNDNGPEFSDGALHEVPVYYCDPRKPQQRGTIENSIGRVRRYIDHKYKINAKSEKHLAKVENLINFKPRRCLGFKTPYEVFFNKTVALVS